MVQEGKPRLETIGTFADLSASHARSDFNGYRMEMEPPELASPEDCADRGALSQGVILPILSRVDVLIDPRYAEPAGAGVATSAGWIRLQDGRQPDSCTLPLFCDAFPPSVFSLVGRTGRVPTIELTVHVRRRPAEGWIRGCFTSRELAGATLVEDGTLWDSTGEVVAQCRQLALVTD